MSGKPKLHFQALLIANEQRNVYGLRYNDYERYRKHCYNRTHRLRSSLKMTYGRGREFKKLPPISLDTIKEGHLQLLLFEAERAWAHSQEMYQESLKLANDAKTLKGAAADQAEKQSNANRKHATRRMRRAIHWATQLLSHCQALYAQSRLSAEDLVQITTYTLNLNGRFLRQRYEFEDALVQLSVARNLLDALASAAATSRAQALAIAFADEIGPEIRHAAHELHRDKAYDVDAVVADVAPKHRNALVQGCDGLLARLKEESGAAVQNKGKLKELLWEGEPVPVRNPELVDVLLKVQEAEERLGDSDKAEEKSEQPVSEEKGKKGKQGKSARSKRGVASYDAILLALSEAEDVSRKLVEARKLSGTTAAAGTRDNQFVHAYIVYQLLSRRVQRDLLLTSALLHQLHAAQKSHRDAGSSRKVQVDARLYPAIVKLLDSVLQSLEQMRTLSIVDESPDLATAVDARISFTKARRCYYLSWCYAPLKKYAEALALTQHASIHLRECRSTLTPTIETDAINDGEPAFYSLDVQDLNRFEEELVLESTGFKNDWFAYNGGTLDGESGKTHKKPLFFDIALNYINLDMDRLQERAGKVPPSVTAPVAAPAPQVAEKKTQVQRAKVEEIERAATPEPTPQARGGLGGLLGGWWGRR
ncbi:hypothetical protein DICSQDRAFT_90092 [Dichomitus squalens LYAD-421 SS1]|uniref:Signal recognition particle subunit SRP68 n=1 Tax=Dichomitus squalens (strain LYAD-421) TaxID=732165 RepID=R7SRH9_DICSQ|nr:uncharacterized protein DICSQDRAFT_90092 [Dichomitus squalens LYAD-421 SS1]EJF58774.1 hypothetical protein DICSQDRAFT_90092 [Dichomitus squalens LYAD-421 SS1]